MMGRMTASPEGFASLLSRSAATAAGLGSAAWDAAYLAHHAPMAEARRGVPGIDYAWSKPSIAAIKAAGEVFVAQYFSPDESKNLTPARAHDLQAAGVKIVVVWEYGAADARRGRAGGQRDAAAAQVEAEACHLPDIPIYWAIDYDEPPGDQGLIDGYAGGWTSELGMDRGGNAYGGYWPLSRLKHAGLIKRLWGTPAWSGNEWATSGLVPDIMQGAMVTIGGVQCDLDAGLSADFGAWHRPAAHDTRTWQVWETKGHSSLADVARATGMEPATILRTTATHYQKFDTPVYDYVNGLASGRVKPADKIGSGGRLWVLR